jgi:phosphohistidine phosphatase SixA
LQGESADIERVLKEEFCVEVAVKAETQRDAQSVLKKVLHSAFPAGVQTLVKAMKSFQTAKQAVKTYVDMKYMRNAGQVKESGLQLRE